MANDKRFNYLSEFMLINIEEYQILMALICKAWDYQQIIENKR